MISNQEFLTTFIEKRDQTGAIYAEAKPGHSLGWRLPHEAEFIEEAIGKFYDQYQKVTAEKKETSDQSGDDWHDKQLVATDEAASTIVTSSAIARRMSRALDVEYPAPSEERATLGSRVGILMKPDVAYTVDIVGFLDGHPSDLVDDNGDEIEAVTPESAIAKNIIGLRIGETALAAFGSMDQELQVTSVDQVAIANHFGEVADA